MILGSDYYKLKRSKSNFTTDSIYDLVKSYKYSIMYDDRLEESMKEFSKCRIKAGFYI